MVGQRKLRRGPQVAPALNAVEVFHKTKEGKTLARLSLRSRLNQRMPRNARADSRSCSSRREEALKSSFLENGASSRRLLRFGVFLNRPWPSPLTVVSVLTLLIGFLAGCATTDNGPKPPSSGPTVRGYIDTGASKHF